MMFPSHLLATLLACALLGLVRTALNARSRASASSERRAPAVSPKEWILAVAFGVAIDLDHLLQLPTYVASQGWSALTPASMLHWGSAWQGFLHTPWALLAVVPACVVFTSWFPVAFWALHMFQDFVVARHLVRFGGAVEWVIVGLLLAALVALLVRDHRAHGAGAGLGEHALARVAMVLRR